MNAPSEPTATMLNDAVGIELVEAIHARQAGKTTAAKEAQQTETRPQEWAVWPPPMASRSDRRACTKRRHEGLIKAGYCALCGTRLTKP